MVKRQMEPVLWLVLVTAVCGSVHAGILYPQQSETREVKSLDGLWKFRTSPVNNDEAGFTQEWYKAELNEWIDMPVPSSFNDITVNASIQNYVSWVWYQREFFVPQNWKKDGQRIFIRFDGVHYNAVVWLNGKEVTKHSGGHLPFQGEVSALLQYSEPNLLTVAVNNSLTRHTIPQGSVVHQNGTTMFPEGYEIGSYSFDFFNYAGIQRPVRLFTVPQSYIDDITVNTDVSEGTGIIKYEVNYNTGVHEARANSLSCVVQLLDGKSVVVPKTVGCKGEINVHKAKLWWPVYMDASPGHRYIFLVYLVSAKNSTEDVYRLPVGIRSLSWKDSNFTINGKSVYLRGFDRHEDSNIRGKGLDLPIMVRDYNLIDWLGANAFRTTHYPYAEEFLEMADARGIMVINESPAVGLSNYDDILLEKHKEVMKELVQRDKNRACVIMWSLSNEGQTNNNAAKPYYKELTNYTRSLDASRPVAFVTSHGYGTDKAAQFVDIIGVNHYSAWYQNIGHLDPIPSQVESLFSGYYNHFKKPLFISEYGAASISGLHTLPIFPWSEDYQSDLIKQHFEAFDKLRQEGVFIGELIWCFADFAGQQDYKRVIYNRKGIFTRERQPKAAAHTLRDRYRQLASKIDAFNWPHNEL